MNNQQYPPPMPPTYAEAMTAQPNGYQANNGYGVSPFYNSAYPPATVPRLTSIDSNYSATINYPQNQFNGQQYQRNPHQNIPIGAQQPSTFHLIPPNDRESNECLKIVCVIFLVLTVVLTILRIIYILG